MPNDIDAPEVETNTTEPVISETETTESKEDTIGELMEDKPQERLVPESVLIQVKRELKDLKKSIKDGATNKEVSSDIRALADKHGVDEDFLTELVSTLKSTSQAEIEEKLNKEMQPLKDKEHLANIDKTFNEHFDKAMAKMPEFDGVANKNVIKQLSLDPSNKNKTFQQLIDEAYGHLVTGKKTLESTKANVSRGEAGEVDFNKISKDNTYYKEVMNNPTLKKKYNEDMASRLQSVL